MGCKRHPTTKFCLFCLVLSVSFHVHLCHKFGDSNHESGHVDDGYPGLQRKSVTPPTGEANITQEQGPNPNQFSGNETENIGQGSTGMLEPLDGVNLSRHAEDNSSFYESPDFVSRPSNDTADLGRETPGNESRRQDDLTDNSNSAASSTDIIQTQHGAKNQTEKSKARKQHRHRQYLWAIFNKYGHEGVMTYRDLERLMKHLGLGEITGNRSDVLHPPGPTGPTPPGQAPEHREKRSENLLDSPGEESVANQAGGSVGANLLVRRDVTRASLRHRSRKHVEIDFEKCLSTEDVLETSRIQPADRITLDGFLKLCPVLVQQLDSGVCGRSNGCVPCAGGKEPRPCNHTDNDETHLSGTIEHRHGRLSDDDNHGKDHDHDHGHNHDHNHNNDHDHNHENEHQHHDHSEIQAKAANNTKDFSIGSIPLKVWGCSIVACFIISAVGLLSVAIVPCMHKVLYNHMLQFLVAMAIGSLVGDALLHLIPHSLVDHKEVDDHHGEHNQSDGHDHGHGHNHKHIWLGLVCLGGIYLFFIIERLMGMLTSFRRKNSRKRNKQKSSPLLMRRVSLAENGARGGTQESRTCEGNVILVHSDKAVAKMAEDSHQEVHKDCDQDAQEDWAGTGHSHGHHHSHQVPGSVAAVAWMVIMGDGLHNFSDGLAIGASFASSLSGGLSTSVAVFCHELPHELGDFAVLLRAGMSVKSALLYNILSSFLCMVGMLIGVSIGNISSADKWIFAAIAGMFIYIALVDMLPELTKVDPRKGESPCFHMLLQLAGMTVGAGIMLLIAVFEDKITFPAI